MWEEPCISGRTGSGTVFFSGCTLRCVYCQNGEIARGRDRTGDFGGTAFSDFPGTSGKAGGEHQPGDTHTLCAVHSGSREKARAEGLVIPIVYNCSGYESVEALKMLDGWIDIYLTDFKYMENETARQYSAAEDYPERAKEALEEMVRQTGEAVFDQQGMMKKASLSGICFCQAM